MVVETHLQPVWESLMLMTREGAFIWRFLAASAFISIFAILLHRRTFRRGNFVESDSKSKPSIERLDFSNVLPYQDDFDITKAVPEPYYRENHIRDYVYQMTMGLRNLPFDNWIVVDSNYKSRMEFKKMIIEREGIEALDCREDGYDAAVELLECLIAYLPRRFPTVFTLSKDGLIIDNHVTGESFQTSSPYSSHHPLYVVGRLIEDDVNLLLEGPNGEYVLKGVASAFPAGFRIQDKMDQPLSAIHKPVPMYKERLEFSMNKFFRNVTPDKLVMRLNWSVNDREELFLTDNTHLHEGVHEDSDVKPDESIDIDQVQLRVERQVVRRLPSSHAVCMLTKTYIWPLAVVAKEPGFAAKLGGLLDKLPARTGRYKRKPIWGGVILGFLEKMAKLYPADDSKETE